MRRTALLLLLAASGTQPSGGSKPVVVLPEADTDSVTPIERFPGFDDKSPRRGFIDYVPGR
jgi:hypothetical protein